MLAKLLPRVWKMIQNLLGTGVLLLRCPAAARRPASKVLQHSLRNIQQMSIEDNVAAKPLLNIRMVKLPIVPMNLRACAIRLG